MYLFTGLAFSITRTPGQKYCARVRCLNEIDAHVSTFTTTRVTVYECAAGGTRKVLASASADSPDLYIDPARRDDVNGTGDFSSTHSEVTLDFNKVQDCERGTFQCELELLSQTGSKNVIRETVSPGYSDGQCTCGIYQIISFYTCA